MNKNEWKEYKLGDVAEKIFSGGTPSTKNEKFWNGNVNWLSSGETRNNYIFETEKKITSLGVKNSSTKLAKKYDIVIASAGQGHTRGQTSICLIETYINQSVISIRVNKSLAYPFFLFFNLKRRYKELRQISDSHSIRGSLTTKIIKQLLINLPPLEEQKRIAGILKSLDDKIELNNQMNKTLEEIAQTLFKHWFVDFGPVIDNALEKGNAIPDEFEHHPKMGWIPKSWEVSQIGNKLRILGGGTPSTKNREYWEDGIYNFCAPKDFSKISDLILTKTERKVTEKGLSKINSGLLKKNTVLMSSRAPIGHLIISNIELCVNQGIIALEPNGKYNSFYIYLWVSNNLLKIKSKGNGSTFQEISKSNFRSIEFISPNCSILKEFKNSSDQLFMKILNLTKQNENLKIIRDKLLNYLY